MNVGAVGAGAPNLPDPIIRLADAASANAPIHSPAASAGLGEDAIATILQGLAMPQISDLFGLIEQARLGQDPMLLQGLLRTAIVATVTQDLPSAIGAITKLITLNPERGAQMVNEEAALTPIRGEIRNLLQHLALGAKAEAERTFAAASQVIETAVPLDAQSLNFDPQYVLVIAQQLIETGQPINFVRAAELGQVIIAIYQTPVIEINTSGVLKKQPFERQTKVADAFVSLLQNWLQPRRALQRMKAVWRRGPLLVLLVGWLCVGLLSGVVYYLFWHHPGQAPVNQVALEIWSVGFLALVIFQFIAATRRVKF